MATEVKTKFPKSTRSISARKAIRQWQQAQPSPRGVRVSDKRVKAVRLNRSALEELRILVQSDEERASQRGTPRRGSRRGRDLDPKRLFGTINSALNTYEFMLMQSEYRRRKAAAPGSLLVETQWRRVVSAAQTAYRAAGLSVTEPTLNGFVKELTANGAYLSSVMKLRQTAVALQPASVLTATTPMLAAFVPTVGTVAEAVPTASSIAGLCDAPFKQGTFTKHITRSVTISVKLKYWCPTWSDPFRTCTKRVTLATVSFTVGIDVGYKLTCCGATAWGTGFVQACASLLFLKGCAGCTGTITGVAGLSRTQVTSGCSYGIGLVARLKCVIAGFTLLDVSYNFGWVVTGPCPPVPCP